MTTPRYPFLDLADTNRPFQERIEQAVLRVVRSGRYIGGEECKSFEQNLARLVGTDFCVGVSNGLDALRLIFRAFIELGQLAPDAEVIVPANTYIASVLAVTDNGLRPVFVEPDPRTLNLDWNAVLNAVTPRTGAIMTVHLYGRACWDQSIADTLRRRGILIVEDNAQAIGAQALDGRYTGSLGDAAAFSFYPTKNVGAIGDAGAVTTNRRDLADMVRALANYGSDRRYHNIVCGYNCRLDPVQAAVLNVKLPAIEEENARRREIAEIYNAEISNPYISLPLPGGLDMVWHQYVVRVENRDGFTAFLDSRGVGWDIHYAVPPHRQPCYTRYSGLNLPVTDDIARSVVSLPVSPSTSPDDARQIAAVINSYSPQRAIF